MDGDISKENILFGFNIALFLFIVLDFPIWDLFVLVIFFDLIFILIIINYAGTIYYSFDSENVEPGFFSRFYSTLITLFTSIK